MKLTRSHELDGEFALKDWLDSLHEHTVLGEIIDGERAEGDFFLIKLGELWVGPRQGVELGQCTSAELAHQMAGAIDRVDLEILSFPPHAFEGDRVVHELAEWVHQGAHIDDGGVEACTEPLQHQDRSRRGARRLLRMALRAAVGA